MTDPRPGSKEGIGPTPGSLPPEKVENRDNVGTATPDDYPKADREDGDVTATGNKGRRPDRQNSGPASSSGPGTRGDFSPWDHIEARDPHARALPARFARPGRSSAGKTRRGPKLMSCN